MNHTFNDAQRNKARQILEVCLCDVERVEKLDDHSIDVILELASKMNVNDWLFQRAVNLE
jgi:hypothetical protein